MGQILICRCVSCFSLLFLEGNAAISRWSELKRGIQYKPNYTEKYVFLADIVSLRDNISRVIPLMPNIPNDLVSLEACKNAAIQNGFPGFALQYGGYCSGSFQIFTTYAVLGLGVCQNGEFLVSSSIVDCSVVSLILYAGLGGDWANDVYQLIAGVPSELRADRFVLAYVFCLCSLPSCPIFLLFFFPP